MARDAASDAEDVSVDGLDRVEFGHSAETLLLTVAGRESRTGSPRRRRGPDPPPEAGPLPPHNLKRQFDIRGGVDSGWGGGGGGARGEGGGEGAATSS